MTYNIKQQSNSALSKHSHHFLNPNHSENPDFSKESKPPMTNRPPLMHYGEKHLSAKQQASRPWYAGWGPDLYNHTAQSVLKTAAHRQQKKSATNDQLQKSYLNVSKQRIIQILDDEQDPQKGCKQMNGPADKVNKQNLTNKQIGVQKLLPQMPSKIQTNNFLINQHQRLLYENAMKQFTYDNQRNFLLNHGTFLPPVYGNYAGMELNMPKYDYNPYRGYEKQMMMYTKDKFLEGSKFNDQMPYFAMNYNQKISNNTQFYAHQDINYAKFSQLNGYLNVKADPNLKNHYENQTYNKNSNLNDDKNHNDASSGLFQKHKNIKKEQATQKINEEKVDKQASKNDKNLKTFPKQTNAFFQRKKVKTPPEVIQLLDSDQQDQKVEVPPLNTLPLAGLSNLATSNKNIIYQQQIPTNPSSNPLFNPSSVGGYNLSSAGGFNSSLAQNYNPLLAQNYNPSFAQGYNPLLSQGYNPIYMPNYGTNTQFYAHYPNSNKIIASHSLPVSHTSSKQHKEPGSMYERYLHKTKHIYKPALKEDKHEYLKQKLQDLQRMKQCRNVQQTHLTSLIVSNPATQNAIPQNMQKNNAQIQILSSNNQLNPLIAPFSNNNKPLSQNQQKILTSRHADQYMKFYELQMQTHQAGGNLKNTLNRTSILFEGINEKDIIRDVQNIKYLEELYLSEGKSKADLKSGHNASKNKNNTYTMSKKSQATANVSQKDKYDQGGNYVNYKGIPFNFSQSNHRTSHFHSSFHLSKQISGSEHVKRQAQKAYLKSRSRQYNSSIGIKSGSSTVICQKTIQKQKKTNSSTWNQKKYNQLSEMYDKNSISTALNSMGLSKNQSTTVNVEEKGTSSIEWTPKLKRLKQLIKKRQNDAVILIGPQFQAELPKFITNAQQARIIIALKKSNLLKRLYRCN